MAAPKEWGYTRDKSFGAEILVAWTDGDLIQILGKEVTERLLSSRRERERLARWARAAHDTTRFRKKDWIVEPDEDLVTECKRLVS